MMILVPFLNLRQRLGVSSQSHPEGEPCISICPKCTFLHTGPFFILAAGLFSRSRLRGTKGGRVYSRRKFGPRSGSEARALGVHSRASLQVITGSLSTEPKPVGQWKLTRKKWSAAFRMLSVMYNSSHLACSPGHLAPRVWSPGHLAISHRGPLRVQQHSRFELVSSCHGAFVCVRVLGLNVVSEVSIYRSIKAILSCFKKTSILR